MTKRVARLLSGLRSAALACGVLAFAPAPQAVATITPAESTSTVVPSAEVAALADDLAGMIRVPGWGGDSWGVLVVSLEHGDTLFAHRAHETLAPASNLKLFTSATALRFLGPQYRYGTYLATAAPIENGVLMGDLHIYGTGDPTLSDRFLESDLAVWEAFADTLVAHGVREVRGDVVGDGSYFSGPPTGTGWHDSYINAWYAAPAGALAFNDNIVTLRVRPADQPGWRPEVLMVPGGEGIAVVNLGTTTSGGSRTLEVTRVAYDGPIVIRGEVPGGSGELWRAVPVPDPARYAAAVFMEVLREKGIHVSGGARSVHRPENSLFTSREIIAPALEKGASTRVLAVHRSPPLLEILKVVNKQSHNFYAEQVLRTVGRAVAGAGSVAAGQRAVEHLLGGDTAAIQLAMDDGSGLSTLNQTSPATVIDLLAAMYSTPLYDTFLSTLPVAGERGLRRMSSSQAQGNLRAKTGTINNVSALSGYVTAANGEDLAFSIMSNEVPSTWRAKRVEDQIGARLASFSRPPPVRRTQPRSPAQQPATDSRPDTARGTGEREDTAASPAQQPTAEAPQQEPATPRTHEIRSGDTLEGIARQYGTTVAALREANPGLNPRRLIPGRSVNLP